MERVFRVSNNIGNVNGFAIQHDTPDGGAAVRCKRLRPHVFYEIRRVTVARSGIIASGLSGRTEDQCLIRLAQPRRRFDQRVEHRR